MKDENLQCILKALNDAARVVVGIRVIARLAVICRKRIKKSKSEEP